MNGCIFAFSSLPVGAGDDGHRTSGHAGAIGEYVEGARQEHQAGDSGAPRRSCARASLQTASPRLAGHARSRVFQTKDGDLRPRLFLASARRLSEGRTGAENEDGVLAGEVRPEHRPRCSQCRYPPAGGMECRNDMGMRNPRSRQADRSASQHLQYTRPGCRERPLIIERSKNKWLGISPRADHQAAGKRINGR